MKPLDIASNIAVIVAASAVAATAIYNHVAARQTSAGAVSASTFTQQYKGKRVPLPGLEAGSGVTTLVLFVSKTCHFCEESAPFYRRLAAVRSASSGRFRMVAAVPQATETGAEAKTYFAERGITLDGAQPAPFRAIGLAATPTLALVSGSGIITDVWTGKLAPDKETEVIGRIEAMCRDCAREGRGVKP